MKKKIIFTRVINATVDKVWEAWIKPELVRRWWGPDRFTCPSAKIDFHEGKSSVVCMRAPKEFGGQDWYNVWTYKTIIPLERIEYVQNLSDENGNIVDPIKVGMPADFPKDTETIVTFKKFGADKTELTFIELADFGQMFAPAKNGLEECLEKMLAIFNKP